jgi:hypothetical protein
MASNGRLAELVELRGDGAAELAVFLAQGVH